MSDLLNKASLVMVPSGYKEDTVYSVIPTDGAGDLSFTRASNGTRINSAGLVEVCPWNLLQYSEDFSNAVWDNNGGAVLVTANATTAPNGTTTADQVENNPSNSNTPWMLQFFTNLIGGQTYTYSVYAKASTSGTKQLAIWNNYIAWTYQNINVTTEWQRFEFTFVANASATAWAIGLEFNGAETAYFIWGAQLNIGSTAKPYFPTTDRLNVPRLTYQNGGGGCPSLLLEKQSTNVFVESENLFTTHLVQNLTTSGYSNVATSPDGTQNADKFVPNSTSGVHGIANGSSLSITSGQAYSFSAFVKSDGGAYNLISLTFDGSLAWGGTKDCIFNASTGASYSVPTGATMSSQDMGNGWYRITATLTAMATISSLQYLYRIYIADANGNLSWAASSGNTNGIFVWGAQLEASSYPTSYIPTTSSSATRVADACYKTGISSLIGSTTGSVFVDFELYTLNGYEGVIEIIKTTGSGDRWLIWRNNANLQLYNSFGADNLGATIGIGRHKACFVYTPTSLKYFVDGVKVGDTTSMGTFTGGFNKLDFENSAGAVYIQKKNIYESVVSKTAFTEAEAIALTTL